MSWKYKALLHAKREDPKESYENMIELVTRAEVYIQTKGVTDHGVSESKINLEDLANCPLISVDSLGHMFWHFRQCKSVLV